MLKVFVLEGQVNCCGSHVDVITAVVQLVRYRIGVKRKVERWIDRQDVRIYPI